MKAIRLTAAVVLALSATVHSHSLLNARRDRTLKEIEACLRRNEVPSRECKKLNEKVYTLVEIYRQGDKTVLPTLLRLPWLGEFYREALTADSEGFLTAVAQLSESFRYAVAQGTAGGMNGLTRSQFDAVRTTLLKMQATSPNHAIAQHFLRALETANASLLLDYFPPNTFTSRVAPLLVRSYSAALYALEEEPLWPPASNDDVQAVYRITLLPAFSVSRAATLTVLQDGSGYVNRRVLDPARQRLTTNENRRVSPQQISEFIAAVDRAKFWKMPTERTEFGFDGATWLLEGVRQGKYHVVERWCPAKTPFGQTVRTLFDLAAHSTAGSC